MERRGFLSLLAAVFAAPLAPTPPLRHIGWDLATQPDVSVVRMALMAPDGTSRVVMMAIDPARLAHLREVRGWEETFRPAAEYLVEPYLPKRRPPVVTQQV